MATRRQLLASLGCSVGFGAVEGVTRAGATTVESAGEDADGPFRVEWTSTQDFDPADSPEVVLPGPDGDHYVVYTALNTSPTGTVVARLSDDGDVVWDTRLGFQDLDEPQDAVRRGDGGLFVAGEVANRVEDGSDGRDRAFLAGVSPEGNVDYRDEDTAGDSSESWAVLRIDEGEYVTLGRVITYGNDAGPDGIFYRRFDDEGNVAVESVFDLPAFPITAVSGPDRDVFFITNARSDPPTFYLVRVGPDGSKRWQTEIPRPEYTFIEGLAPHPDGGVTVLGNHDGYWLGRVDELGTLRWQRRPFEQIELLKSLETAPGRGYLVGGRLHEDGQIHPAVSYVTADAEHRWTTRIGSEPLNEVTQLDVSENGDVLAVGDQTNDHEDEITDAYALSLANRPPDVAATASPSTPSVGETVTFDAGDATDPEYPIGTVAWDLDGTGSYDVKGAAVEHTFESVGIHEVGVRVTDTAGKSSTRSLELQVRSPTPTPTESATATSSRTGTPTRESSPGDDGTPVRTNSPGLGTGSAVAALGLGAVVERLRRRP